MPYTGELAALTTAFLWSFGSLLFTSASRRIGGYWVNKFRIPVAAVYLAITLLFVSGRIFPAELSSTGFMYLAASGIIGLSLGDNFLFKAFVLLGPRVTLLIFTISPIITSIFAWIILGETLGLLPLVGIGITLAGIAWVTAERGFEAQNNSYADKGSKTRGVMLAIGGAVCQSIGLVLAKAGMSQGVAPLEATFLRMLTAAVFIWIYGLFLGDIKQTGAKLKDKRALLLLAGGAVCGPFLGVWMSLVAVKNTQAGIAAAIMAAVPVMVIPLVIIFYKEKVSWRAVFGAIATVAGVGILFLA